MASPLISSITPASLSRLPKGSVAVCAHDAGAASHMAAWLSDLQPQLRLWLAGPAQSILSTRLRDVDFFPQTLEEALSGAQVLISGTGWASDLEHQSRKLARELGIPSVAVLDHWLNYRERFQRVGQEQLPDVLWVADVEAASLASSLFPNLPIQLLPNLWLERLRTTVKKIRSMPSGFLQPRRPARRLLYLLEPIRVPWSNSPAGISEAGEIQSLRYLLQRLPQLIDEGFVAPSHQLECIGLRPHPSEPSGKYDAFISQYSAEWPISLEESSSLEESLAWADAAFGCETQALVAAMACDLSAFSTLPPWAPPCRLPQDSLIHLVRLNQTFITN